MSTSVEDHTTHRRTDPGERMETAGPVAMVLKAPRRFAQLVEENRFDVRSSILLLCTAAGFHAIYGLAMGVFSGGDALWNATLKAPLILLATLLFCAPSLYVLLGLSGSSISVRQTLALLSGLACLSSLLMLGFAPVAWLFGVSTSSVHFMVVLHVVTWTVGMAYGLRLLARSVPGGRLAFGLAVWVPLFLLVSAQMFTYFRPVLGPPPPQAFRAAPKKFFFQHFFDTMATKPEPVLGGSSDEYVDATPVKDR